MTIICKLKNTNEVNPPEVNYTWFSCDSASCDENSEKLKNKSQFLQLNSQSRHEMNYRCIAENAAGNDYKIITVRDQKSKSKTWSELKICDMFPAGGYNFFSLYKLFCISLYSHCWILWYPVAVHADCITEWINNTMHKKNLLFFFSGSLYVLEWIFHNFQTARRQKDIACRGWVLNPRPSNY